MGIQGHNLPMSPFQGLITREGVALTKKFGANTTHVRDDCIVDKLGALFSKLWMEHLGLPFDRGPDLLHKRLHDQTANLTDVLCGLVLTGHLPKMLRMDSFPTDVWSCYFAGGIFRRCFHSSSEALWELNVVPLCHVRLRDFFSEIPIGQHDNAFEFSAILAGRVQSVWLVAD